DVARPTAQLRKLLHRRQVGIIPPGGDALRKPDGLRLGRELRVQRIHASTVAGLGVSDQEPGLLAQFAQARLPVVTQPRVQREARAGVGCDSLLDKPALVSRSRAERLRRKLREAVLSAALATKLTLLLDVGDAF